MFNYTEIENWHSRFDISDDEAERIAAVAKNEQEFTKIWENEDWWTDKTAQLEEDMAVA